MDDCSDWENTMEGKRNDPKEKGEAEERTRLDTEKFFICRGYQDGPFKAKEFTINVKDPYQRGTELVQLFPVWSNADASKIGKIAKITTEHEDNSNIVTVRFETDQLDSLVQLAYLLVVA